MAQIFDYDSYPANQEGLWDYLQEKFISLYCIKMNNESSSIIDHSAKPIKREIYLTDLTPSNLMLLNRHIVYLPKKERDSLLANQRDWVKFFEAQEYLMSNEDYPEEIPQEERTHQKANVAEAMKRLHELADGPSHFPAANYFLALAYNIGWKGQIDNTKAIDYLKKSAKEYLIADACYLLGLKYNYADGLSQNQKVAKSNFKEASNRGHAEASYLLGQTYHMDGKQNKSFQCYKLAADLNHAAACHEVGKCYAEGRGTNADIENAKLYYKIAIENGNKAAQDSLDRLASRSPHKSLYPKLIPASSSDSSQEVMMIGKETAEQLKDKEIQTLQNVILSMQSEMLEIKKRLAALENPKAHRKHGGKESPSKRLKLQLNE